MNVRIIEKIHGSEKHCSFFQIGDMYIVFEIRPQNKISAQSVNIYKSH